MRLFTSAFIILICLSGLGHSQEKQDSSDQFDPKWGIGIICQKDNKYPSGITSFPKSEIAVYGTPGGVKIGTVGKDESKPDNQYAYFDRKTRATTDFFRSDMIEVGYEGTVMKYYRETTEYVNVLIKTIPGGGWILKADLDKVQFKTLNWINFLLSNRREYYYKHNHVDLRSEPDSKSELLGEIGGDLDRIKFTGKHKGNWAEVKIDEYDNTEDEKVIDTWSGWIQAVDEKGKPRIWFYTRGM